MIDIKKLFNKETEEQKRQRLLREKQELNNALDITKMEKENSQIKQQIKENKREEFLNSNFGKSMMSLKDKLNNRGKKAKKNSDNYIKNFKL